MPASEPIDNLLSPQVIAAFDELNAKVNLCVANFEKLIAEGVKLNGVLGSTRGIKEVNSAITQIGTAEQEIARTTAELNAMQTRLTAQVQARLKAEKELSAVQASRRGGSTAAELAELKKLEQAQADAANSATAWGGAHKKASTEVKGATVSARELAKQKAIDKLLTQQQNMELKNQAREQIAAKGSIEQRRAALIRLTAAYDNLNERERASPFGVRMLGITQRLSTQLKNLEAETGRAQRNVGNYPTVVAGGFAKIGAAASGAFRTLSRLAYIIPGLGIAGIFNLAFDAISGFIERMKGAQTATERAAEAAEREKKAVDELMDSFRNLNQIRDDAVGETVSEITKVQTLAAVIADQTNSYKQRNSALKELQGINKNYFGDLTLEAASLKTLTARVTEYSNALITQAIIKQTEGDIGKVGAAYFRQSRELRRLSDEVNKARENMLGGPNDAYAAFQKLNEAKVKFSQQQEWMQPLKEQFDLLKQSLQELTADALQFKPLDSGPAAAEGERIRAITQKLFDANERDQIAALKSISENESLYFKDRLDRRQEAYDLETRLSNEATTIEIENEKAKLKAALSSGKTNVAIQARQEYAQRIEEIIRESDYNERKLEEKLQQDLETIRRSANLKKIEDEKATSEEALQHFADQAKAREEIELKSIQKRELTSIAALAKAKEIDIELAAEVFQKRIKAARGNQKLIEQAEKEFQERRLQIEVEYSILVLESEIRTAKAIIALRKSLGYDTSAAEKALAEAEIALSDMKTKHIIANNEKQRKSQKETIQEVLAVLDQVKAYTDQVMNIIGGAINASVTTEKNRLQDRADMIERTSEREIEAINASTDSEEKKAARIQIVQARTAAQKDAIDRRQRQLDQRKAEFDRAQAIVNIILNTATAVTKAMPNFFLAGLAGALGAAQLAVALATPIPRYKHGTWDAEGGLSLVGEGGKPEMMVTPEGRLVYIPASPQIMNVPKHSIIFPDANRAMQAGLSQGQVGKTIGMRDEGIIAALKEEFGLTRKTIANKREIHLHPRKDGWDRITRNGNTTSEYLNRNLRG